MYYCLKYDIVEGEEIRDDIMVMKGKDKCYNLPFQNFDYKSDLAKHLNIHKIKYWVADKAEDMTKALTETWEKQGYHWEKVEGEFIKYVPAGYKIAYKVATWEELVNLACVKWARWKIKRALTT